MTSGSYNPAPPSGRLPSASSTWATVTVSPSDASASISPWYRPEGFLRDCGATAVRFRFGTYGCPLAPDPIPHDFETLFDQCGINNGTVPANNS